MRAALRKDFVQYLDTRNCWPTHRDFTPWVRNGVADRHPALSQIPGLDGMKTETYSELRAGLPVETKFVDAFLAYYLEHRTEPKMEHFCDAMHMFLSLQLGEAANKLTPDLIRRIIAEEREDDALTREADGVQEEVLRNPDLRRFVGGCSDTKAREVVTWLYLELGSQRRREFMCDVAKTNIQVAEKCMGLSIRELQDRATLWRKANKWCVLQSVYRRQPIGGSIVLPLRGDIYDEVRAGKRETWDIEASHILPRSDSLLLFGLAPSQSEVPPGISQTVCHQLGLLQQIAELCPILSGKVPARLRAIAVGGTPLNEARLRKVKYKDTGNKSSPAQLPLYERVSARKSKWPTDIVLWLVLSYLQNRFCGELPRGVR